MDVEFSEIWILKIPISGYLSEKLIVFFWFKLLIIKAMQETSSLEKQVVKFLSAYENVELELSVQHSEWTSVYGLQYISKSPKNCSRELFSVGSAI